MFVAILAVTLSAPGCRSQEANPDGEYECQHGSTCRRYDTSLTSGFTCDCLPGSFGRSCEYCKRDFMEINDKCVSSYCVFDGVTECGGAGDCVFSPDSNSWSCGCKDGFLNVYGVCISQVCISNTNGQQMVCNGKGVCERLPGGMSSTDYSCRCSPIYSGDKCNYCNPRTSKSVTHNNITECVSFDCFKNPDDSVPCGGNGRCVGRPSTDQFVGIDYTCECNLGFDLVEGMCVSSTCVFNYMGEMRICGYDEKFQNLCVETRMNTWECNCPDDAPFIDKYGCTPKQCIASSSKVPCSGLGVCYLFSKSDKVVYKCTCPSFASGEFCQNCNPDSTTEIDGVCVPQECVYGRASCNNHGTCLSFSWHNSCECDNGYDIVVLGTHYCGIEECHDRNTNLLCSGAGICDEDARICVCIPKFQYVQYGMCVPETLISANNKVCSGNGHARLKTTEEGVVTPDPTNPDHWTCECTILYSGENCSNCNLKTAFLKEDSEICVSRDCYNDGYKKKENTSDYIDKPQELCTFPMASSTNLGGGSLGTCSNYVFGDKKFFACTPDDKTMYQQGYNHSSIYPIACTTPGKYYTYTNFVCGLLENRTIPMKSRGNICISDTTPDKKADYICQCDSGYTLISQTLDSKIRYTCMHSSCLNPGASEGSTNINDYCNGLGDCVINPLNPPNYYCICGKGSRLINGVCISKACISEEVEGKTPVICGNNGKCVFQNNRWGCQCTDTSKYIYVANSCYPRACVYTQQNPDGDTFVQLCGGDETSPGGTCHVDNTNPDSSYCSCNDSFARFGNTCVNKQCVSVDLQNGFHVTKDSICSGTGYCLYHTRGDRGQCICNAGSGTSIGPFCTSQECVTIKEYQHDGALDIIYLNCGRPGAGICKDNACVCNDGYKILETNPNICARKECVDDGVYCGGDFGATCVVGDVAASCVCSSTFMAVNGTCVPLACYAPDTSGAASVCGGPGVGTCVSVPSTKEYQCTCSNDTYVAAKVWYNGYLAWTCAPKACVDGSNDAARVCGSSGGSCVGLENSFRCKCADGFVSLSSTQCISVNCISQNASGNDDICSGGGTCIENVVDFAITYSCGNCKSGFKAIKGKCVSDSCLFQVSPTLQKFYICGKLGSFGTCVGTGQGFECLCSRSSFLVRTNSESYCVPFECSDSYKHPAECGTHGTCVRTGFAEFNCTCNPGYETVDTKHGHHYCVSNKCKTGTGADTIICNNHGRCRNDACVCDSGYDDGSGTTDTDATARCTECAAGYKEYVRPAFAISKDGVCVRNNCGKKISIDDCGGPDVADSNPCQYNTTTFSYQCVCKPGFFPENGLCQQSKCTGEGVTVECGGPFFGICKNNVCTCLEGMKQVKSYLCVSPRCISDNTTMEICNNQGICAYHHWLYGCVCNSGFISAVDGLCYPDTCFYDKEHFTPMVCDGHENRCVSGECVCNPPFRKIDGQDGCIHANCIINDRICGDNRECRANPSYTNYTCVCSDGFILAADGTCQSASCSSDGKTICDNSGTCKLINNETYACECNALSANYQGGCKPLACFPYENPLFSLCGGNGICNLTTKSCVCNDGSVLVQDFLCQPKTCISNKTPNYLCSNHGVCEKSTKRCECYEGYEDEYCTSCASGYKMGVGEHRGSCFPTKCGDNNCRPFGSCLFDAKSATFACRCIDGYYYNNALQTCRRCVLEHCSVCEEDLVCGSCDQGYYLSKETGLCKECDDDCLTCSGPEDNQCLSCKPGKVHSTGTGSATCIDECKENTDGCSVCGAKILGSKYCSVCSIPNYFSLEGVCSSNSQLRSPICNKISNGQCTECVGKYFLYEGGCYSTSRLPGKQVCKISNSGRCLSCADGYYKEFTNQCLSCSNLVKGCAMCTRKQCTACFDGYYPNTLSGSCEPCESPCKKCSDINRCTSCREGYFGQFLVDASLTSGECRRCDDTSTKDGLAGISRCKKCLVYYGGSADKPAEVYCEEFSNLMSGGAIAGITITVLVLLSVGGFCVWWFVIRNKKIQSRRSNMNKYSRGPSDPDSTSLLSIDATTSLL